MNVNGGYDIHINTEEKIIYMDLKGTFPPDLADSFNQNYLSKIRPVDMKDYILKIDCLKLNVILPEELHKPQISVVFYKKSGFKKIQIVVQNPILKGQIERLMLFAGIDNVEFMEHK
ncbi:hypothetical protein CVD28_02425 [Bacillus sp. M6-12]|uniref:hypothetical protein n=1 Tax=Bacillus sp. M6-12 TaxID=2054166 RepID=UPI000C760E17|nr:hypothetical protein [Bacillus sp. M6-12]PLS19288.1 hypothetical protein CVD28_02425 [Bacillus sp. M6-12]